MPSRSRLLAALIGILVLGGAAAAAAHEDDLYTFSGAGWGHSVGLSQYGAYGQALDPDKTAQDIVTYYYDGVSIEKIDDIVADGHLASTHPLVTDPDPLWVGIRQGDSSVEITPVGGPFELCRINDDDTTTCTDGGWEAGDAHPWTLQRRNTGTTETPVWTCEAGPTGEAVVLAAGNCRLDISWGGDGQATRVALDNARCVDPAAGLDRECFNRGTLHVRDANVASGFHIALEIDVEGYLYGLGEMPSSWPAAALQAQALAGRSYAVFRLIGNETTGLATAWEAGLSAARQTSCWCHIYSTVKDQNYVAFAKEGSTTGGAQWVAAVDATADQVITHPASSNTNATVIQAFYHSSSGGWTESNETVWAGAPVAYIAEREDAWSVDPAVANPFASWTYSVTAGELADALGWDSIDRVRLLNVPPAARFEITGRVGGETTVESVLAATLYAKLGTRSPHISGVTVERFLPFHDIETTVHQAAIVAIWEAGITTGCDAENYCPLDPVTRAQMATFLNRAMDLPAAGSAGYADVNGASVHEPAINAITAAGISNGCEAGLYCPGVSITRAQMATFLARALGLEPVTTATFSDVNPASVHAPSINAIAAAGISLGCADGVYCPNDPVTRAQMATFLARAFLWSTTG